MTSHNSKTVRAWNGSGDEMSVVLTFGLEIDADDLTSGDLLSILAMVMETIREGDPRFFARAFPEYARGYPLTAYSLFDEYAAEPVKLALAQHGIVEIEPLEVDIVLGDEIVCES